MNFKKLLIIVLVAISAINVNAQKANKKGIIKLFNGKDFTGWKFQMSKDADPANTWSIVDGMIHCVGKPNGFIRTVQPYSNFKVTTEWRFVKPGNTGMMVFMQEPDAVWPRCVECQGMHDHQGDFWIWGGVKFTKTPDMVLQNNGVIMQKASAEKPVGEWNTYQVVCEGNSVEIIVNGQSMNKITGCDMSTGYIGLQSEGAELDIRSIIVEPLK